MLLESLELSDCAEEVNELTDTTAEKLELSKDLSLIKVELASLRHGLEALLGEPILLDVGLLEVLAALKHCNELVVWVLVFVPKA